MAEVRPRDPEPGESSSYWRLWGIPDEVTFLAVLLKWTEWAGADQLRLEVAYNIPDSDQGRAALRTLTLETQRREIPLVIDGSPFPDTIYLPQRTEPLMAALVIPNVYRCSIEAVVGSEDVVNVVHIRGSSSGLAVNAATAIKTAWEVALGPLTRLSFFYGLTGYTATDLSSLTGSIATAVGTAPGGVGTECSTAGTCALIKWNGGTRSRSTRGRMYLGPVPESFVEGNGQQLTSSGQSGTQTAIQNFRNSLTASGFTLVVASRKLSIATDVVGHSVDTLIGMQRGRIR